MSTFFETAKCVVLNASYEPLTIVSAKRALVMYIEERVDIVEEHPEEIVRSEKDIWPVPTQVVLKKHVKSARSTFHAPATLTQRNLFIRDKYTCQYCGRSHTELLREDQYDENDNLIQVAEMLTRDHVIPRDRGGQDVWENVVTACSTCNNKKANYMLNSVKCDLTLQKEPTTPTLYEIWRKSRYKKL